ncbi:MAG TPA: hypothetical protein VKB78_09935, partial [Pirellulales bacterium]|nr:hypothetical protein [Pirellulales bacterium]
LTVGIPAIEPSTSAQKSGTRMLLGIWLKEIGKVASFPRSRAIADQQQSQVVWSFVRNRARSNERA